MKLLIMIKTAFLQNPNCDLCCAENTYTHWLTAIDGFGQNKFLPIHRYSIYTYVGQFVQGGGNGRLMSYFF